MVRMESSFQILEVEETVSSTHWTDQVTISSKGRRCVVETNWHQLDGPLCQMIWVRTADGGCLITTCSPDVAPIRLTAEQCAGIAEYLIGLPSVRE